MLSHFLRTVAADDDPNFRNVTLLLPGNGTNGAQNNTFLDSSTNNYTITRNGNPTQGTFTPYGPNWSNYFDGNGDYLTVPDNAAYATGTNNFTLECWVYPTQNSAAAARIISQQGSAGYWVLRQETNTIAYFYLNASTSATVSLNSGAVITPNLWYHLAVVRNGNSFTLYVNGVSVATGTSSGAIPDIARVVAIGAYFETTASEFFTGNISNIRLVSGSAVYTAAFIPPAAPLTAITGTVLLTCQSNRLIDNSSNNFTVTKNGDVSVQRFSPFNPTGAYESTVIGGSGYFDGTNDFLSFTGASFSGQTALTIEMWVYPLITPNGEAVYAEQYTGAGDAVAAAVFFGNNTAPLTGSGAFLQVGTFTGSAWVNTTGTTLTLNAWSHIAAVYSSSTWKLYVNGTLIATSGTVTLPADNDVTYIARRWDTAGTRNYFGGYISNVRVVRGTAVYTGNFTPPTAPVTAITNTSLLLNYTNAGIIDNAMMNDLETVGNAQISTAQSVFGGASLAFDGTGDWLASPDSQNYNLGSGEFTIEFWLRFNSVSGIIGVMGKRTSEANYAPFVFGVSSSTLQLYMSTSGSTWAVNGLSTATLSTNTWYHVAATRSGNTVYLFLGGVSVGSTGTLSGAVMTNTSPLYIGASSGTPSGATPLNGYIDDLRITKGVARYTANFTPPVRPYPTR